MADSTDIDITKDRQDASAVSDAALLPLPLHVGRYQVERVLGKGGFGLVYLAHDQQLGRRVAVKVPHARLVSRPEDANAYLVEARNVANLDHPNIVQVYDVGSDEEFPFYLVCKYIEGTDLSKKLEHERLDVAGAVRIVATVAKALHHAHQQGLVHRDIKPGNILIDNQGTPYVVDFGLALREENLGTGPKYAGTPLYMSPEQARGEGHRVDGRSDIFSLGVVLYELLVGKRPFRGETRDELMRQVTHHEPRPLRQYDDHTPRELERICLKALAKRASERYFTAQDFADDLVHFLQENSEATRPSTVADVPAAAVQTPPPSVSPGGTVASSGGATGSGWEGDNQRLRIVPKGLRSFDVHDADFFLDLLPGPRDRSGLPESIRFWKSRIEELDSDSTFAVGVVYGPSGCGKSSFVKAGLLPRLRPHVSSVFIDAAPDDTEGRLLRALRKRCSRLQDHLGLTESIATLRRGDGMPAGHKLLIVIDQFEQWLHAQKQQAHAELVNALRQCNGGQVQCIVMVRDDFWMATTRFMRELEVRLVEARNSAAVDLFPIRHAETVLSAFGRAFGALPDDARRFSKEQREFLRQSIAGLADDGKVIPVRLALFAEMMKDRAWTPATLKQVGGTEGVGVTFLEETFAGPTAPPQHRVYQKPARAVLKALLPQLSTDIKAEMKSDTELKEISGLGTRPRDFDELMEILDRETRLITPTDPDVKETSYGSSTDLSPTHAEAEQKYYQLTHDYLVRALREWLTSKQRETIRGRAELRLADRAAQWVAKPEKRHLPTILEWVNIRLLTDSQRWTEPQRNMMRTTARVRGTTVGATLLSVLAMMIAVVIFVNVEKRKRTALLVDAALAAAPADVLQAVRKLEAARSRAIPLLRRRFELAGDEPAKQLHAAVALAKLGECPEEFLLDCITSAPGPECINIIAGLENSPASAIPSLRSRARDAESARRWNDKARLAVVALHLGDATMARDMLRLRPDPIQRTILIRTIPSWHGAPRDWLNAAEAAGADEAFRSGACLGVAGMPLVELPASELQDLTSILSNWYLHTTDGGTHSAANWALRQWRVPLPSGELPNQPSRDRDWYVNSLSMTMLKIKDPTMPPAAWFYLSDREVSTRLFKQYLAECPDDLKPKPDWPGSDVARSPTDEHPVQQVSWIDAVRFCNWLSLREGLTPCYEQHDSNWDLVASADGYRLPTEVEWECACRAGTTTVYASGDDVSLLAAYAVCYANQTAVCGSRLPNAWGVFDAHGNVYEWCQDLYSGEEHEQEQDGASREKANRRVLRGGAFDYDWKYAASAASTKNFAWYRSPTIGFRVARSYPDAARTPAAPALSPQ